MRSAAVLSLVASSVLVAPALAFRDTSPFLLWNTDPSKVFDDASKLISGSSLAAADDIYSKMSTLGCEWENVVIMNVDKLHQSHLSSINHPTHDAHLHIPYLTRPHRRGLSDGLGQWAEVCGAEVVSSFEGMKDGQKNVVILDVKGDAIPSLPSNIAEPYILLLTGSDSEAASTPLEKRQERPFPTHITSAASATETLTSTAAATGTETESATGTSTATTTSRPDRNSTIPTDGPLLDRVQLLTTPIIVALLITFGLFLPIAGFGVTMLAGIQVPPRMMEIGKGLVVGKERKDQ